MHNIKDDLEIEKIDKLKNVFYKKHFSLAKMNWMGTGGCADEFLMPNNIHELSDFLKHKTSKLPISIIGAGSNILISDKGIRGTTIKFGKGFAYTNVKKQYIFAGSATTSRNLATIACRNAISGFEFLFNIPGTVGGAISMNAGCFGSEISDVFVYAIIIDRNGDLRIIDKNNIDFIYRGTNLDPSYIICGACFMGSFGKQEEIHNTMLEKQKKRQLSQPIQEKTLGCVFKNPCHTKSWRLIDEAGCRGMRFGGAAVSEKHSNFIINNNNASSFDVQQLIIKIKSQVINKFGVELIPEIKILGEFD